MIKPELKPSLILFLIAMLFLALSFFFSSCSDARRLQRIEKRHPEWVKTDTIMKSDTTVVQAVHADSTFIFQHLVDTFTLTKDKLSVRVIRDHDTLRVSGDVKADTIVKQVPLIVKTLSPPKPIAWWQCLFTWIGGVFLLLLAIVAAIVFITGVKPTIKL